MIPRELGEIGKPISEHSVRAVSGDSSERSGDPAASSVPDDEDIRHMEVLHGELHRGRCALVVHGELAAMRSAWAESTGRGGRNSLGDVAMDEDVAGHRGGDHRLGDARIGAPDPEDLVYGSVRRTITPVSGFAYVPRGFVH